MIFAQKSLKKFPQFGPRSKSSTWISLILIYVVVYSPILYVPNFQLVQKILKWSKSNLYTYKNRPFLAKNLL